MESDFNLSEKLQKFEGWHSAENRFIHISHIKKFIEIGDKLHGFIEDKQRNTPERENARKNFVKYVGSYSESENEVCDVNLSTLPD